jgi:pSer/pThr/pTyr-binding forkhead associated (FHA) protein/DNA-directed RNA polymerase subunit RPC12/RpoP
MQIACPSCGSTFDLAEDDPRSQARAACPRCGRVVVVSAARTDDPGTSSETVPLEAVTDPVLDPVDETTSKARPVPTGVSSGRRVSLAILSGPQAGDVFHVGTSRVVIGRKGGGTGADLEIDDGQVSRAHAAVESHGTKVVLQDLGSSNGTFVGEEPVKSVELADRDEFRVGVTRLMLIVAESD